MANLPIKAFFQQEVVQEKIQEVVGQNSKIFTTTLLQIVNGNQLLANAEPVTVLQAALMATSLGLPINQNLGFAYIVPYKQRIDGVEHVLAQFQIGYKGLVQLAHNTKQFKRLKAQPVHKNELISKDYIEGFSFDWNVADKGELIGYYAMFRLDNGFEDFLYMTVDELKKHAKRYSQSYRTGKGVWVDNFEAMAEKTVTKLLLAKKAPLSIELQRAINADQAVINSIDGDYRYVDNENETEKQAVELTYGVDSPEREEIIVNAEEIAKTGNSDNLKEYLTQERRKILGVDEYRRILDLCKNRQADLEAAAKNETPF